MADLQASESRVLKLLQAKLGQVCSRDDIAQALWGKQWTEKYSDWMIDTLIYRLRHKIPLHQEIITVRNQGYILKKKGYESVGTEPTVSILKPVPGIAATEEYLNYMNHPDNVRKILSDLFTAAKAAGLGRYLNGRLLVINSYSFDNIDAVKGWKDEVVFTHYDERALGFHRRRLEELALKNVSVLYDDIRRSRLADKTFDLLINDFRLNFNTDHHQNRQMAAGMRLVLRPAGKALVSVVCGQRKRWFKSAENLPRIAFATAYYRRLFRAAAFKIVKEFDSAEGRNWYQKMAGVKQGFEPGYVRFLLQ